MYKVTTTKKNLRIDLEKLNWAFQDATRARKNKRQEQERETKSGGGAVAGGAVNWYPQSAAVTIVVFLCEHRMRGRQGQMIRLYMYICMESVCEATAEEKRFIIQG